MTCINDAILMFKLNTYFITKSYSNELHCTTFNEINRILFFKTLDNKFNLTLCRQKLL